MLNKCLRRPCCTAQARVPRVRNSKHVRVARAAAQDAPQVAKLQSVESLTRPIEATRAAHIENQEVQSAQGDSAPATEAAGEKRPSESDADGSVAETPQRKEKQLVPQDAFPVKVGDLVVGKVTRANNRGGRVELLDYPGISGFMPKNRGPFAIRDAFAKNPYVSSEFQGYGCIPEGVVRQFEVFTIPEQMEYNGRGPLLNAKDMDVNVLWTRLEQVFDVSKSMRETVRVQVRDASDRGLMVVFSGVRGFVPMGHIPKEKDEWLTKDDLKRKYVGKEVEVSMIALQREKLNFTASMVEGKANRALRQLQIGSLVWGTVRLVRDYGVFIAIDNTFESALLHVTNMSWERVNRVEDLFCVGDRVRSVVTGMDDGYTRLSVSTKDIEKQEGDMLLNKELVFMEADQNVKPFLEHVAQWQEDEAADAEAQQWE